MNILSTHSHSQTHKQRETKDKLKILYRQTKQLTMKEINRPNVV